MYIMYLFGFSNNRIVSIFMLLAILVISLAMSAYLPILEGIDETGGANAANANATTGETDINKIIAQINAQSQKPTEPVEKPAIAGITLNDKYTEQTIDAEALSKLLKNSTQVQAIMNPILPPKV
jgi:preprotein translocase subunit SecF